MQKEIVLALPIYEYLTTIVVVDDSPLFAELIRRLLGKYKNVKTFCSGEEALSFFGFHYQEKRVNRSHFLRAVKEDESYVYADHCPVDLNITEIAVLRNSLDKMREVSVLITDLNMGGMSGLELCSQLQSFPMKKILLTSSFDDLRQIVAAFNDDIIDRFIIKGQDVVGKDLCMQVDSLMRQYFIEKTQGLLAHLEADHPLPFSDEKFVMFFNEWASQNNIKEFYIIDKQGSLLTVDEREEIKYFIIHTDESLLEFTRLHADSPHTQKTLSDIRNRKKIPFFGIGKEAWQFDAMDWDRYLYPAKQFVGRRDYYWAEYSVT